MQGEVAKVSGVEIFHISNWELSITYANFPEKKLDDWVSQFTLNLYLYFFNLGQKIKN